jgi:lipoprotein-anchoring transpeptidase ErfK/SrfK
MSLRMRFCGMSAIVRPCLLALTGMSLSLLGGCLFVTDTQLMNTDVFTAQTAPVWDRPAPVPASASAYASSPAPAPAASASAAAPAQPRPPVFAGIMDEISDQLTPKPYGVQIKTPYVSPFATPMQKAIYAQMRDDGHTLSAIPLDRVNHRFLRQQVDYPTSERPGTIVVDTEAHYLYLVEKDGKAIRYGVGLGKQGFAWKGRGVIQFKKTWPRWTPSDEMVSRQPDLRPFSSSEGGLEPGLRNPLGARAMYIFQNGKDTLYRVHGTPDWQSVGKAVSSGCVRMFNQDVIDLYDRVSNKSEIVVL